MGPSGSGKSTLLAILGCLDSPTRGIYHLDGQAVENLNEKELAAIRRKKVGFVFQQFNLLPRTSALENVMLPLLQHVPSKIRQAKGKEALEVVGLADRLNSHPNQLSGGEQQRIAVARALINEPSMILADEPTGNLDTKRGSEIIAIFQHLNRDKGQTIIYVTHDPFLARHTNRIIQIQDGKVFSDRPVEHPLDAGTPRPEAEELLEDEQVEEQVV